MSLADLQARGPHWLSDDDHWLTDFRVDEVCRILDSAMISVAGLARLWKQSKRGSTSTRQLYYAVKKLGLQVKRQGRSIYIPMREALAYADDDADVSAEIITRLVNYVSYGDNTIEKAQIRRCFEAWLAAHPYKLGSGLQESRHENDRSARW
jgi:hypothetical protein